MPGEKDPFHRFVRYVNSFPEVGICRINYERLNTSFVTFMYKPKHFRHTGKSRLIHGYHGLTRCPSDFKKMGYRGVFRRMPGMKVVELP